MSFETLTATNLNMDFAYRSEDSKSSRYRQRQQRYEATVLKNAVALAVIHKLHRWCCQLFWLTLVCVIGCYGELSEDKQQTIKNVRKNISLTSQKRSKTISDLEMQLLRHLTCPQTAILRPISRSSSHKKRHLSRPPSPQLFDIFEETDDLE
ncbi:unnamed protein product [Bursaphelenchus okinawaensis]|uniref:Uncharacterized protein n=1 Tax=Bursaphelenchus okinawaensis TaxID=465554 RepID=A0A811K886_9BILA|nr:unnamed protein product [Bursaphelenchus okinawaensis]CAG9092987.1 unnamed protein product [Bursaphelenchus okinawaensis]